MLSRPFSISHRLVVALVAIAPLGLAACSSSRNYQEQQFSTQSLPPPQPQPRYGMAEPRPYGEQYLPPQARPAYAAPNTAQSAAPVPPSGMVRDSERPYGSGYSLGSAYEPPRAGEYRWNGNPNRVREGAAPPNMTPPPAAAVGADGQRTITVRPGDTLYSLSRHYGVPVAALAQQNALTGTSIQSGQVLVLPPAVR